METVVKAIGAVVLIVVLVLVISLIMAFPVMWLVNGLIVPKVLISIFGTPQLSFWQALGLNLLCGILFKSTSSNSK